jgi:hypothetical protein
MCLCGDFFFFFVSYYRGAVGALLVYGMYISEADSVAVDPGPSQAPDIGGAGNRHRKFPNNQSLTVYFIIP